MDMGLGKTAIVLSALREEHFPALVIAPKRVAEEVWPVEWKKWRPDLRMAVAVGDPMVRDLALNRRVDVTVISRDNQGDVAPGRYKTIILDELSGYKGRGTRWKEAKRFCAPAKYVWGLTGTPSPNGLMDLWAQLRLLDNGERLGKYIGGYRERYFTVGKRHHVHNIVIRWDPKPEAEKNILGLIEDICLSMRAISHLDLPKFEHFDNPISVPLPKKIMRVYREFEDTLVAHMEILGLDTYSAENAAILTNKLSQICAGFIYGDEDRSVNRLHNLRTDVVQEVMEGTGSQVLAFYQYQPERDALLKVEGARSINEKGIIAEWDRGNVPLLVAHPQSAGHGLNLQYGGHTEVWSSLTWSLEEWDQGVGRLQRQGQKNKVMVHHLVSPGTVDEAKEKRVLKKMSVQDALMEYLER